MTKEQRKYCPGCQKTKNVRNFHKHKNKPDGLASWCKECANGNSRRWAKSNKERRARVGQTYYEQNKDKVKAKRIEREYGLSPDEHKRMKKEQNNLCKLCGKPETGINGTSGEVQELCVDHCHETGKVRGLLCRRCNHLIACLGDTEQSIEKVLEYMKGGVA